MGVDEVGPGQRAEIGAPGREDRVHVVASLDGADGHDGQAAADLVADAIGEPAGQPVIAQGWIADTGAPAGVSATPAVTAKTP